MPIPKRSFYASGAIAAYRFVKFAAADNAMAQASASTDMIIGISNLLGAEDTRPVDVGFVGDVVLLDIGGTVTRGQDLTSDANGKGVAVTNTVAAATNTNVGAVALQSGVDGDRISVLVFPKKIQIRS